MEPNNTTHNTSIHRKENKKIKRTEILEKKKTIDHLIKAASSVNDHLSSFPAFRHYNRNGGISVYLESGRGDMLSPPLKQYIQSLLKLNMEEAYGSEWLTEEKVKRREMVATEARYIFVHEAPNANTSDIDKTTLDQEKDITTCVGDRGSMVGFVHYRFTIEEEVPVLYVYELQLEPRFRGKELGKFLMQLIELIARKNRMGAVVLTVLKANLLAMSFYVSKMRYSISTISPSKVDPLIWSDKSYEILCKAFDQEARAHLEDKA